MKSESESKKECLLEILELKQVHVLGRKALLSKGVLSKVKKEKGKGREIELTFIAILGNVLLIYV